MGWAPWEVGSLGVGLPAGCPWEPAWRLSLSGASLGGAPFGWGEGSGMPAKGGGGLAWQPWGPLGWGESWRLRADCEDRRGPHEGAFLSLSPSGGPRWPAANPIRLLGPARPGAASRPARPAPPGGHPPGEPWRRDSGRTQAPSPPPERESQLSGPRASKLKDFLPASCELGGGPQRERRGGVHG